MEGVATDGVAVDGVIADGAVEGMVEEPLAALEMLAPEACDDGGGLVGVTDVAILERAGRR